MFESSFSIFRVMPQYGEASNHNAIPYEDNISQNSVHETKGNADNNSVDSEETSSMDNKETGSIQSRNDSTPKAFSFNFSKLFRKAAPVVWLTGASGILLYMLLVNALQWSKFRKYGICQRQDILEVLNECQAMLKVRTKVTVVYNPYYKSPALYGLFRPKIMVNQKMLDELSRAEMRYIFLHELAHLKRKDLLPNAIGLFILAVYWYNPLIWYSIQRMKQDCEIACDAAVLDAVNPEENKKYGLAIINMLNVLSAPGMAPGTVGFAGRYNKRRITMITQHKKTSIMWTIPAVLLCILIFAGCSSVVGPSVSTGIVPGNGQDLTNNEEPGSTPKTDDSSSAVSPADQSGEDSDKGSVEEDNPVLEAYKAVLQDQAEFFSTDNKKSYYLNDFLTSKELYEVDFKVTRFTVLDMDGDNVPEVVLELSVGDEPQFFEVLHNTDGKINGYFFTYRGLIGLKADGTFSFSSGAADNGLGKLRFEPDTIKTDILGYSESSQSGADLTISYFINNESVSKESFDSLMDEQSGKKDAAWFEFSEENIGDHFSESEDSVTGDATAAENNAATKIEGRRKEFIDSLDSMQKELDALPEKKDSDAGVTNAMRNYYGRSYEMYDKALNEMYALLKKELSPETMKELQTEEIAWIEQKEAAADQEASKYEGGTFEPVARYISLYQSTKERCYELVNEYMTD
jgi:beta-lactamase regulating signal transducer with metallopeptidase domain/uncharacterized protein YecT (DUF1311 family)